MYRCDVCSDVVGRVGPDESGQYHPTYQRCIRRVVETRERRYYSGNSGSELVKEIKLCKECDTHAQDQTQTSESVETFSADNLSLAEAIYG